MTFTVFAVETITGRNLGPLDCAIKSWARVLNGGETASVTLHADADGRGLSARTLDWYRQVTEPAQMSLAVDWDGIPLWAGPVWNRARGTNSVDVSAAGIATILARRKAVDPLSATPVGQQVLAYSGISLATIAKRLVQLTQARTGGRLPIVFGPDEADGDATHVRNYLGKDLPTVGELLTQLTGVIGGPDIDFRPEWVDTARTALRWRMVTGTVAAPKITSGNQLAFEWGAQEGNVRDLSVAEDASNLVTDQWAKGQTTTTTPAGGGESVETVLISRATSQALPDLGWPLLEGQTDYSSVTAQATLDAHAAGDLGAGGAPVNQWGLTVDALTDPPLGSYTLGDLPTVHVQNDFWIPDGTYPMRIVQISGDHSTAVKVDVQSSTARALDIPGSPAQSLPARIRALERAATQQ